MNAPDTPDSNLSNSLAHTIANSELTAVGTELSEIAIDSLLDDGVLKELPIIGTLTGLWKTGVTIRDALFVRKLLTFLNGLSEISIEDRTKMIASLDDEKTSEAAGERILSLLDRLDSSGKAKIVGKAFKLYSTGVITKDELWRVSFIVERLPLSDIIAISEWQSVALNAVPHIRKHLYLTVGVGWFVLDISSNGFQWHERLCTIFSNYILPDFMNTA